MIVKWQSDSPKMELVIPKGEYLPYELPVATKEVLGGVKVDGDTINITSDGVISTQKVDLSGVATKAELEEVENKIPSTSGLATKDEVAMVESKIPDTSDLATKVELGEVAASIPETKDFATKTELNAVKDSIPNSTDFATQAEMKAVENKIPDVSNFATRRELNAVQDSIPNTSGLATKVELATVENKIPDVSGFATKSEIPNVSGLATKVELNEVAATIPSSDDFATKAELDAVQSSIPDTSGLATKVELDEVKTSIPNTSGFATKNELNLVENKIPSIEGLATKNELDLVENKIPDVSNFVIRKEMNDAITTVEGKIPNVDGFATKQEVQVVKDSIPSTSGLATKVELSNVEAKIPTTYLETANLGDGSLTIINNKGESVVFTPSAAGGGGTTEKEWLVVTADIGTVETEDEMSYSTLENVSATKADIKAAYAAGQNILLKLNDTQIMNGIVTCMPFNYTPDNDSVDLLLLGTMLAGTDGKTFYIYYSMEDDTWSCNVFQMEYLSKSYGDQLYVDKEKTLPTLATKAELPTEYVKSVNSANNALTFTTNSNNTVEYKPIFYVNATMDGITSGSLSHQGGKITADKTYAEIKNALTAGQTVQLKIVDTRDNSFWVMTSAHLSYYGFLVFSGHGHKTGDTNVSRQSYWTYCAIVSENDTWSFRGDNIYRTAINDSENWVRQQAYATQASLSNVEAKIPDVSNFATTNDVETAITNKGYQTQTQVQALINDAISNIKNANEVSY